MKRIHYHRYGGPEVLRLEEAELAPPSNGQVVIEIRAAAANAMDWKIRNADMRLMTIGRFPRGVGHDVAGVVKAVGQGVTDLHARRRARRRKHEACRSLRRSHHRRPERRRTETGSPQL